MAQYLVPQTLEEALDALGKRELSIVAGGTDFYPARVGKPIRDDILDLSGLDGLRGIVKEKDRYRIGALTTWSDVVNTPLPPAFDGLKQAAREVGGLQIQNAGTVGGNICNASPAADGSVPLLAMDARVEVCSQKGAKQIELAAFVTGNRRTLLQPGEILTAVLVPIASPLTRSVFLKLGARRYLVISIVSVAVMLETDAERCITAARIAVGACSEVPLRLTALEEALEGKTMAPDLSSVVAANHLDSLSPIDDVRATAGYRLEAARTLIQRGLESLASPS